NSSPEVSWVRHGRASLYTDEKAHTRWRGLFVQAGLERYFDTAASCLIAADIARTRVASFAPFTSASTCAASVVSALPRAAPVCFSASSSDFAIAVVRAAASPLLRTS